MLFLLLYVGLAHIVAHIVAHLVARSEKLMFVEIPSCGKACSRNAIILSRDKQTRFRRLALGGQSIPTRRMPSVSEDASCGDAPTSLETLFDDDDDAEMMFIDSHDNPEHVQR